MGSLLQEISLRRSPIHKIEGPSVPESSHPHGGSYLGTVMVEHATAGVANPWATDRFRPGPVSSRAAPPEVSGGERRSFIRTDRRPPPPPAPPRRHRLGCACCQTGGLPGAFSHLHTVWTEGKAESPEIAREHRKALPFPASSP